MLQMMLCRMSPLRTSLPLFLSLFFTMRIHAESAVTITVGPANADFIGSDSAVLQKAADEVSRRAPSGNGILAIQSGTYTMYDSLHIRTPMTVRGSGASTILKKSPQVRTNLMQDFDLSEYVCKVQDPAGLSVGMGVSFKDKKQHDGWDVSVRTIVAIEGHDVRLDRRPERDYALRDEAWVQNSFPLISGRNVKNVIIEDLLVDGNLEVNRDVQLDGCRSGGIYLNEASDCVVRRCVSRNTNGDGISWQTTENILVENCESYGHTGLGFHPGTGSPYTIVRNCKAHHNGRDGLYLCWGVRHGRFENNVLEENGNYGISIGHKDTDNLFVGNIVRRNGVAGVGFRNDPQTTAGHRCVLKENVIEDNGRAGKSGVGVLINGETTGTILEGNTIRDTRAESERTQKTAIEVGSKAEQPVTKIDNKIDGLVHSR